LFFHKIDFGGDRGSRVRLNHDPVTPSDYGGISTLCQRRTVFRSAVPTGDLPGKPQEITPPPALNPRK